MKHIDTSRERTKRRIPRRFMGVLLAAAVTASVMPVGGFAVSDSSERTAELCAHHSVHTAECGFSEEDNAPCGYECRICPVEDLIAALPEQVTEDNADDVRAQLEEILALYGELNGDEQGQIDLSRCYELQEALDNANAPMQAAGEINISQNLNNILTSEDGGCPGHTFTGTTAIGARIYVASGTHDVTFSNLNITASAAVGVAPGATMNLTIVGTNTIKAGNYAGIYVPKGANLVITAESTGTLDVSSSNNAGIGGAHQDPNDESGDPNCGTVEINGGTITATGGSCCAGIGGGSTDYVPGNGGDITINGGTVTAIGGSDNYYGGAGIGGVANEWYKLVSGNGGTLTINGGTVNLTAGTHDPQYPAYGFGQGSGSAPDGTCELTLADASYLDSGTTLDPNGKYTINGDPTEAMIVVPEDLIYNGKAQELDGKIYIDDTKTGSAEYFGRTFAVKAGADGWVLQDLGEVVEAGEYTATFKKDDKEISKKFTVAQSGTDLADGKVKTYNGETETTSFSADDTITVKATPTATGTAPTNSAMFAASFTAPGAGQMAVFVGDTQVSEPVGAGEDGSYTMTVSAADVLLAAGDPGNVKLTARFVESASMAGAASEVAITISAIAKIEMDGATSYVDKNGLLNAFDIDNGNNGAVITLLEDVELTGNSCISIQIDCTLDFGGHTILADATAVSYAVLVPEGKTVTIRGAGGISGINNSQALQIGGNVILEGGTFSCAAGSCVSVVSNSASLSVTSPNVRIENTAVGCVSV